MRTTRSLAFVAVCTFAARAGAQSTISVAEVRPGMHGYGLTVFSGTEPERFDVEVIGVLRRFLPRQDIILIRARHPQLEHAGIVAGMSGSPIYIEGRLAGALAYGWRFAKDPVAGVTPIANMTAELSRPIRGPTRASGGGAPRANRDGGAPPEAAAFGPFGGMRLSTLLSEGPRLDDYWSSFRRDESAEGMVPAATPLFVSGGLGHAVRGILERVLSPFALVPMQGGGGGAAAGPGPRALVAGGALGVQLVRGDIHATAVGTVTAIEGGRVLAFGHPMFNSGETYIPVTTARVHMVLASLQRSFKIAEPIDEAGSLVEDRQSCIIADPHARAHMVPLVVTIHRQGERTPDVFHMEVVQHRFLTPVLALSATGEALESSSQDLADVTFDAVAHVDVADHGRLELTDHGFSPSGVAEEAPGLRVFEALEQILTNPFEDARIDRVEVDLSLRFAREVSEIRSIYVVRDVLEPGERVDVYVTLLPYGGSLETRTIPIEIPREASGRDVEIEVAGGARARPETADPENLGELLYNLRQSYPATALVASVRLPSPGVALRGHVVRALPASALEALRPANSSDLGDPFITARRVVVAAGRVVHGRERLRVHVRPVVR